MRDERASARRREVMATESEEARTLRVVAEAERMVLRLNEVRLEYERFFERHNITKEELDSFAQRIRGSQFDLEMREKLQLWDKWRMELSARLSMGNPSLSTHESKIMEKSSRRSRSMV